MVRIGVALFGTASWLLAGVFAILFPRPDSLAAAPPATSWGWAAPVVGIIAYALWLRAAATAKTAEENPTAVLAPLLSFIAQTVLIIAAAAMVHRDFISLFFQAGCLHYALFLEQAPRLNSGIFFRYVDRLYSFTLGIIGFFLSWIALMGYAISVRSEPRWIPAIGYNLLNFGLCFFLYLTNLNLRRKTRRELVVADDSFLLDRLDITPLFNPKTIALARFLFLNAQAPRLTCKTAQSLLGNETDSCDCSKATLCPRYKYLYNRVHELKRVVAALRLGTVIDPDKRRDILTEGWRFVPDASVAVIDERKSKKRVQFQS